MDMDKSDQQLIEDYFNGDEQSLETLIDRYLRSVYGFIYRICQNKDDTEDASQETFFKAWKSLGKYRPEESFKTWLFTIARNSSIDLLRKRRSIPLSAFEDEDGRNTLEESVPDDTPTLEDRFHQAELSQEIQTELDKLTSAERQVVSLKYENGFTFEEIGRIIGKPLNTVKSQYRRALSKMHQNLINKRINNHDR